MPWLNPLLIVYALLNIGLGIDGALHGSVVSVIAGVAIGVLMLGSVALAKTQPRAGRIASLVIAVAVLAQFLRKFLTTHAWLPAGTLVVASAVVILALLWGHMIAITARKAG